MSQLIEDHLSYARAIAGDMLKKLPPSVDRSDVESAAYFGLVQAANAWDASRGISFTTFAYYRIRGAIYDNLRQTARLSKFERAANDYMVDYTSTGQASDAAKGEPAELKNAASTLIATYVLSLESLPHDPIDRIRASPSDELLTKERSEVIQREIARLPVKNRAVMEAYYFEDLSLEETGKKLGLSKSWVCRVHAKSLELLREKLSEFAPVEETAAQFASITA